LRELRPWNPGKPGAAGHGAEVQPWNCVGWPWSLGGFLTKKENFNSSNGSVLWHFRIESSCTLIQCNFCNHMLSKAKTRQLGPGLFQTNRGFFFESVYSSPGPTNCGLVLCLPGHFDHANLKILSLGGAVLLNAHFSQTFQLPTTRTYTWTLERLGFDCLPKHSMWFVLNRTFATNTRIYTELFVYVCACWQVTGHLSRWCLLVMILKRLCFEKGLQCPVISDKCRMLVTGFLWLDISKTWPRLIWIQKLRAHFGRQFFCPANHNMFTRKNHNVVQ